MVSSRKSLRAWTSTGRIPSSEAPIATPVSPFSDSGVSNTRAAPNFLNAPSVVLEIGDARFEARPGESFRVEPGVWHRFTNRFAHVFVQMLEVSTHHDDNDVERREPSRRLIDETEPPHRTDHRAGDSVCGPAEGVQRAGSELECLGEGDGV